MAVGHDDQFFNVLQCHFTRYVRIQDKLIVQYYMMTIYRSQHTGVSLW